MEPFDSIICVGQTPWEGDFQKAVVQLMRALAVRHRVLYVDYQFTLRDWATGAVPPTARPDRLLEKPVGNGRVVHVWQPPLMLPVNFLPARPHDWLLRPNADRLAGGLRRVMRQLQMRRPLVINAFNPVSGLPLLGRLNEWATIYYCFDEITAEAWMSRHGSRYEPLYLSRVDAVITTSEALRQTKSAAQPRTYCVKNGVNFDLFHQARSLAGAPAGAPPVVGYLGTADDRVDAQIVAHCAGTLPHVRFQFVGEVRDARLKDQLASFSNVEFVPPRQPADLPPLLAKMRAAIIPYVCNAHTYTIYPLKINEYLAAGLPVVSTPFSILDEFDGIIERAAGPEAFAQALRRALADNDPQRLAGRIATARANAWERRAEEFEAVIERLKPRAGRVPA